MNDHKKHRTRLVRLAAYVAGDDCAEDVAHDAWVDALENGADAPELDADTRRLMRDRTAAARAPITYGGKPVDGEVYEQTRIENMKKRKLRGGYIATRVEIDEAAEINGRNHDVGFADVGIDVEFDVRTAFRSIPELYRRVLYALFVDGARPDEVAADLGITPAEVIRLRGVSVLRLREAWDA